MCDLPARRGGPNTGRCSFFVPGTGSLQIRRIDEGQRQRLARTPRQQRRQQLLVDVAQPADPGAFSELVQHPHIGEVLAIGQVGKAPPSPLLGQQPHQVVENVHGAQNTQQMDAVQLRRTELRPAPPPAAGGEQIVDEVVRNIRRQEGQILGRTCGGQLGVHRSWAYPKQTAASIVFDSPDFSHARY